MPAEAGVDSASFCVSFTVCFDDWTTLVRQSFVDAANQMKAKGELPYTRIVSGDIEEQKLAVVPADVGVDGRERASFRQVRA